MMVTDGPFTRRNLRDALSAVCAAIGMDDRGARLIRYTNNAVYELAGARAVVRIVGSPALRHRVDKVVRVARWFAEHDVPAVRLFPGFDQPVVVGDYAATVWRAVIPTAVEPTPSDLARLLRQVHRLPPPGGLPAWDPLDDVRRRIAAAEGLDPADAGFLWDWCASVEAHLVDLDYVLPAGFVHGDAHLGNLIAAQDGPVLCDFDSSSVGPPEWDLTPLAVGVTRFGESRALYTELAQAYGFDVTGWPGFPVLRAVRELKLVTSVLPIMNSSPQVRPELYRRLRDVQRGEMSTRWSRYM